MSEPEDDVESIPEAARVAVCTIVRGRERHLANLLIGVGRQTRPPDRVVVAVMGEAAPDLAPPAGVGDIRVVEVPVADSTLPLAAARNSARDAADDADVLIFLDVDVIPAPDLVADYLARVVAHGGVWSGRVDYLPPMDLPTTWTHADLAGAGTPHPSRPPPETDRQLDRPELFWSLSFALRATTFDQVGGFDPMFRGYGAEDTDFALRLDAAGTLLHWTPAARGYHQHHPTHHPPVQHLADIVANARRFHSRWGRWPMEGWLDAFASDGLISWSPAGADIALLSAVDSPSS